MRDYIGSFLGVDFKEAVSVPHKLARDAQVIGFVNRQPCSNSREGKDFHPYEAGVQQFHRLTINA
jgi:hypothetical protein